ESLLRRSREIASHLEWSWWEASLHAVSLDIAWRRGDLVEAERQGRESLAIDLEDEHSLLAVYTIAGLARIALERGELERAGMLWGSVAGQREDSWGMLSIHWVQLLREETRAEFLAAVERGSTLELWDAAAYALES